MTIGYSTVFPWGPPTNFEASILSGEKIHTIREDRTRRWKAGNSVQHVTGNRTKRLNKFKEGTCDGVQDIEVHFWANGDIASIRIDKKNLDRYRWPELAKNDGLSMEDFAKWFGLATKAFAFYGRIIHFTNLRY